MKKIPLSPHILWCSSQHESPSSQPHPGTLKLRPYNKNSLLFDYFTSYIEKLIAERSAIRKMGKEAKAGVKEPSLIELVGRALAEPLG